MIGKENTPCLTGAACGGTGGIAAGAEAGGGGCGAAAGASAAGDGAALAETAKETQAKKDRCSL